MKTIRMRFGYKGAIYKFVAKFRRNDDGLELTAYKNNRLLVCRQAKDGLHIYNRHNGVEVVLNEETDDIVNIILWDRDSNFRNVIAVFGEFEYCRIRIRNVL